MNKYWRFTPEQIKEMIDKIFQTNDTYTIQNLCNPLETIFIVDKHMIHISQLECVIKGFTQGYSDVPQSSRAYYMGNEAVKLAAVIGEHTRSFHYFRGDDSKRQEYFTVYDAIAYIRSTKKGWLNDSRLD